MPRQSWSGESESFLIIVVDPQRMESRVHLVSDPDVDDGMKFPVPQHGEDEEKLFVVTVAFIREWLERCQAISFCGGKGSQACLVDELVFCVLFGLVSLCTLLPAYCH